MIPGPSTLGLLTWILLIAGYGWSVWRLGRIARVPHDAAPGRESEIEIAVESQHVSGAWDDVRAMVTARRSLGRHAHPLPAEDSRDAEPSAHRAAPR